jgi:transposase
VLDVERWAELRREHFVRGVSIRELMRRTGLARNTIRVALRSQAPPAYERSRGPSKLDPFREEIHELLRRDPRLPGVRVRELIEPLGFRGGKTIVDDYLREMRPVFLPPPRTFQRTVYRPGEICQFDLSQTRPGDPGRQRSDSRRLCGGRRRDRLALRRCWERLQGYAERNSSRPLVR